jgi:hypothetical protein
MSRPPLTLPSSAPATIGPPAVAPTTPEVPKTYVPNATGPVSPSAPAGTPTTGTYYHGPESGESTHAVEPPRIQNVPPLHDGPQLDPTPNAHPDNEKTTSRPVLQAMYFQLLPSPPAAVPAQTISLPAQTAPQPVDDGGWHHAEN